MDTNDEHTTSRDPLDVTQADWHAAIDHCVDPLKMLADSTRRVQRNDPDAPQRVARWLLVGHGETGDEYTYLCDVCAREWNAQSQRKAWKHDAPMRLARYVDRVTLNWCLFTSDVLAESLLRNIFGRRRCIMFESFTL